MAINYEYYKFAAAIGSKVATDWNAIYNPFTGKKIDNPTKAQVAVHHAVAFATSSFQAP